MDVAYSLNYDRLVAVGTNAANTINVITSDDHGLTWTSRGNVIGGLAPYGAGVACSNFPNIIVVFGVVSNGVSIGQETVVATSTDGGVTWSAPFIPLGAHGVARRVRAFSSSFTTKKFVAGGDDIAGVGPVFSSLDGITWAVGAQPAGCKLLDVQIVNLLPSFLTFWLGIGVVSGGKVITTSPDLAAWTARTSPMDGGVGESLMRFDGPFSNTNQGHVVAVGGKSPTTYVMTGLQGSWTARHINPFDSNLSAGKLVRTAIGVEGVAIIGGDAINVSPYTVMARSTNGYSFFAESTPFDAAGAYINSGLYRGSFGRAIIVGKSGNNTIMTGLPGPVPVPSLNAEFSI